MFPHNRWHWVALPRDRGSARTVPTPSLLPYTKLRKTPFRSEIPQRSSHVSPCEISMRNNFSSHILTQYPTQHATGADLCEISTPREMRSDATRRGRRGYFARRAAERRRATCQIQSHGNAPLSARSARRTFRFPFGNGGHSSLSGSKFRFKGVILSSRLGWEMVFEKSLLLQLTLHRRHGTLFAVLYQTGSH